MGYAGKSVQYKSETKINQKILNYYYYYIIITAASREDVDIYALPFLLVVSQRFDDVWE